MSQLRVDSHETLSGLKAAYEQALTSYQQPVEDEDGPDAAEREGSAWVLSNALFILIDILAAPTATGNPEKERKSRLVAPTEKLQEMLEGWKGSVSRDQPEQRGRIAMMQTVLANLAAIKRYV